MRIGIACLALALAFAACSGESSAPGPGAGSAGAAADAAAAAPVPSGPVRFSPNTAAGTSLSRLLALPAPALEGEACSGYAEQVIGFADTLRAEAKRLSGHGDAGAPADAVLHLAEWLAGRATTFEALSPPAPAQSLHRELAASAADLAASLRELLRPVGDQATPAGPRLLNAVDNLTTTLRELGVACGA